MVIAKALSTRQTGDEGPAVGQTLSTDSRSGDYLSRDQTTGDLLPALGAHRDRCNEDRGLGGYVRQVRKMLSPQSGKDTSRALHQDGSSAVAARRDTPPDTGTRVAQHDAEPIDVNWMASRFQSRPSLAPAQMNLQPPLLSAL